MQFPGFSGWTCIFCALLEVFYSCRKRGRELIIWVKLNIFGFLWKNKLKVTLQIHNCFWDEFWQCPLHNSVWYQITSEQKGMLLGFHHPQNASADQHKKWNISSNNEVALANRNKMLWRSSDNRISPGQVFVSPLFSLQLHLWSCTLEQLLTEREDVLSTAVRESLYMTHTYMPAVRMMHPFQAWSHSYHTRGWYYTLVMTQQSNFSWCTFLTWFYSLHEENKREVVREKCFIPMVWLSFMTSAMSHCLAPPSHYSSSDNSSAALRMEHRDAHTTRGTRGSGTTKLPSKSPQCPSMLEKMNPDVSESKDPSNVHHKSAQTTM